MRTFRGNNSKNIRDITGTGSFTDTDDQVEMPHGKALIKIPSDEWSEFDEQMSGLGDDRDWVDNPIAQVVIIVLAILVFFFAIWVRLYWLAMFCVMMILTSNLVWPRRRRM